MLHRPAPLLTVLAALSLLAGGAFGSDSDNKKNPKTNPDSIGDRDVAAGVTSIHSRRRSLWVSNWPKRSSARPKSLMIQ